MGWDVGRTGAVTGCVSRRGLWRPGRADVRLIAWLDDEPVGWCAVSPRSHLDGLKRLLTVPWKDRDEDREDPSVWSITCLYIRKGYRRRGIASALVRAAANHARSQGARAVEGYPILRTDVINEELHVGTTSMFKEAGFRQVSAPTPRRLVMRIGFQNTLGESDDSRGEALSSACGTFRRPHPLRSLTSLPRSDRDRLATIVAVAEVEDRNRLAGRR